MPIAARLVCLSLALSACKPSSAPRTPDTAPSSTPSTPDSPATAGPEPSGPPQCEPDGEPWDGKPGTCFYEHAGCCYPTPEAMCTAAGCDAARCLVMESSPAQARCADPPPTS